MNKDFAFFSIRPSEIEEISKTLRGHRRGYVDHEVMVKERMTTC